MTPSKRDVERRVDKLEPKDEDDTLTVRINHEHVDEDGEVVDEETELFRLGTDALADGRRGACWRPDRLCPNSIRGLTTEKRRRDGRERDAVVFFDRIARA